MCGLVRCFLLLLSASLNPLNPPPVVIDVPVIVTITDFIIVSVINVSTYMFSKLLAWMGGYVLEAVVWMLP